MNIRISGELINGKLYYTVRQFAQLTNKSEKAVYNLISKGNAIRKLKVERILGKPMIPSEEYTDYVFTGPGRYPLKDLYRYTADGVVIQLDAMPEIGADCE